MKSSTMILVLASFVGGAGGHKLFAQDGGDSPPRRESEDPSYEPNRSSTRVKSTPANPVSPVPATPATAEMVYPPGPRVKYILDGKPVYEGDAPVAEPVRNTTPTVVPYVETPRQNYEAAPRQSVEAPDVSDRRAPADDTAPAADVAKKPARAIQTQSARVAGRGRYTPPADGSSADATAVLAPAGGSAGPLEPAPYTTRAVEVDPNDLTADKPGTLAAQNPNLLEEMLSVGPVSSRARKCYAILGRIKTNVETISRCMDRRGKENARLVHTSEELSKDISDMALLWPRDEEFRSRSATFKRLALIFNDELNQTPWQWTEVRWGFDAIMKNVVGYREFCRGLADAEPKPIAVVDKKTGAVTYQDAPDPFLNTVEAKHEAALQATRDEIAKRRKFQESTESKKQEDKEKIKLDLDSK